VRELSAHNRLYVTLDDLDVLDQALNAPEELILLMRSISETLAGRASYLTLWPMTRREQLGAGRAGIWDELLRADDDT
jgi:predicted AAA+ superfamily ATPase